MKHRTQLVLGAVVVLASSALLLPTQVVNAWGSVTGTASCAGGYLAGASHSQYGANTTTSDQFGCSTVRVRFRVLAHPGYAYGSWKYGYNHSVFNSSVPFEAVGAQHAAYWPNPPGGTGLWLTHTT